MKQNNCEKYLFSHIDLVNNSRPILGILFWFLIASIFKCWNCVQYQKNRLFETCASQALTIVTHRRKSRYVWSCGKNNKRFNTFVHDCFRDNVRPFISRGNLLVKILTDWWSLILAISDYLREFIWRSNKQSAEKICNRVLSSHVSVQHRQDDVIYRTFAVSSFHQGLFW